MSLVVESGSLVVESVSLTVAPRCYWWVWLSPETLQSSAWVLGLGLAGMFLVPVPYCRWLCIVVGGCLWLLEVWLLLLLSFKSAFGRFDWHPFWFLSHVVGWCPWLLVVCPLLPSAVTFHRFGNHPFWFMSLVGWCLGLSCSLHG